MQTPLPDADAAVVGGEAAPDEELRSDQLDHKELFGRIMQWWKDDDRNAGKWREQAEEDYAFEAGHQWSPEDVEKLTAEMRPVITFNRVGPIVDVVSGLEINNREEIGVEPRSKGDGPAAGCATDLIEQIRDDSDVEDEETDAFRDCVVGGMAWIEHRMVDVDETRIVIERVDPFEMRWDLNASKRNLDDAKRIHRARDIALDDARAMFPGVKDEELDAAWARGEQGSDSPVDRDRARQYDGGSPGLGDDVRKRGRATIVETQWEEVVIRTKVTNLETGEVEEMPDADAMTAAERGLKMGMPLELGEPKAKRVVYRAFTGREILDAAPLPVQGEGYTYKPITGKWDRKEKVFYGIVRMAKDPQRWANKWLSQTLHQLNTGVKKQVRYEEGAFVDQPKAERDWTKPGAFIPFNEGALTGGKVQIADDPGMPAGQERLLQFAVSSIRDVTGINLELLGMADRDQPGILEHQRKQAGVTILAVFFDNLRRYRKSSASLTLRYALDLLPVEQLLRIVGEERQDDLQSLMAPGAQRYDIVCEESPTSANAKERAWAAIQPMLPLIIDKASPAILAQILEASPLPDKLAAAITEQLMAPPDPQAQQMEQAHAQLDLAGKQAAVQDKQASATEKQTQAQLNQAKSGAEVAWAATQHAHAVVKQTQEHAAATTQGNTSQDRLNDARAMAILAKTVVPFMGTPVN